MPAVLLGYLRRHHIGLLALFVAFSGTAYAASLPRNSVGPKQLKRNAVTSVKVRNGTLKPADFAKGTLLRGATGARGPAGRPGSDAQFTGAAAGGDLAGTFPNPTLKPVPAAAVLQGPGDTELVQNSGFVVTFGASSTGFTLESYDTGNIHDPAEREVLKAPQTGLYLVSAELNFDPDTGFRTAGFAINGATCCGRVQTPAVSGSNTLVAPSAIMALTQGEKVTLRVTVSGAAANVNVRQATFAMHWLGPLP